MSRVTLRLSLLAGCTLGALACESPRPRIRPRSEARTSSRTTSKSAEGKTLPPGHVAFVVEDADLETQVLPIFAAQAGIQILWAGESRKLSLRLPQPMRWAEALDLVCQFTKTHATRDWQGRLVLKDGWHGRPTSETLGDLTGNGSKGAGSVSTGGNAANAGGRTAAQGSGAGASQGSGSPRPNPTPFGSAYSGGSTADKVLKGTTTTQAGGH